LAADIQGLDESPGEEPQDSGFAGDESAEPSRRVNFDRVRSAFCSGVYLTLVIFIIMIGYLLVRGRLQPYTRRLVWQPRDEFDDNS
jgi:hypothetical protein